MLVSLVIQVKPVKEGTLPAITGPALHAVFFHWLEAIDPTLTTELHDLKGLKPFTVSNLQPGDSLTIEDVFAPSRELVLKPEQLYWFRLTSLDQRLSELLLNRFYEQPPATFDILKRLFKVQKVIAEQAEHPWANITSWQGLVQHDLFSEKSQTTSLKSKVKLIFYSPTTFKAIERVLPIPLPQQTFTSLANRWNTFSPVPLDPDFFNYLVEEVTISSYQLQTELALLGGSKQGARMICFRGWCEYIAFGKESEWFSALRMLGHFAFFCGIGYKTGMGFGQTLAYD